VLLEPNLVEYEDGQAIDTHPMVVVGAYRTRFDLIESWQDKRLCA